MFNHLKSAEVLVKIEEQVSKLVVPELFGLCKLMQEYRHKITQQDDDYATEQHAIEEAAWKAAHQLMALQGVETRQLPTGPYRYQRLLTQLVDQTDKETGNEQ